MYIKKDEIKTEDSFFDPQKWAESLTNISKRTPKELKEKNTPEDGEVEMVLIKVEKGYMTTPMAWIRKVEKARGEQ